MDVRLPDGRILRGVPEGTTQEEIIERLKAAGLPYPGMPTKKTGLSGAFMQGAENLYSSTRTGLESLLGNADEAAAAGLERGESIDERYANEIGLDKLKEAYEKRGVTGAIGEGLSQIPKALAQQAPNIASTLAGAKVGARFGPAGAILGAAAPSFLQQFGSNLERQAQVQQDNEQAIDVNRGTAIAGAAPQAALDVAGTLIPLGGTLVGKLLGPEVGKFVGKFAGPEIEKLAKERLLTAVAKGLGVGALAEIPTEVTQQMIERAQAGLPLLSEDALAEYGDVAYQSGLLAPLGGIGRVVDRASAKRELAEKETPQVTPPAPTQEQAKPDVLVDADPFTDENLAKARDIVLAMGLDREKRQNQFADKIMQELQLPDKNAAKALVERLQNAGIVGKVESAKDYTRALKPKEVEEVDLEGTKLSDLPANTPGQKAEDEWAAAVVQAFGGTPPETKRTTVAEAKQAATAAPTLTPPNAAPTTRKKRAKNATEQRPAVAPAATPEQRADTGSAQPAVSQPTTTVTAADVPAVGGLANTVQNVSQPDVREGQQPAAVVPEVVDDRTYTQKHKSATIIKKLLDEARANEEARAARAAQKPAGTVAKERPKDAPRGEPGTFLNYVTRLNDASNYWAKRQQEASITNNELMRRAVSQIQDEVGLAAEALDKISRESSTVPKSNNPLSTKQAKVPVTGEHLALMKEVKGILDRLEAAQKAASGQQEAAPLQPKSETEQRQGFLDQITKPDPEKLNPKALPAVQRTLDFLRGRNKGKSNDLYAMLADRLRMLDLRDVKVYVEGVHPEKEADFKALEDSRRMGEYRPKEKAIYLRRAGLTEKTFLHEVIHAATIKAINQYDDFLRGEGKGVGDYVDVEVSRNEETGEVILKREFDFRKQQQDAVEHLYKIYDEAKAKLGGVRKYAHVFNRPTRREGVLEFIAVALTESDFQSDLAKLRSPHLAKYTRTIRSLWNQFTEALANILGMVRPDQVTGNAMLEATEAINKILGAPVAANSPSLGAPSISAKVKQAPAYRDETPAEFEAKRADELEKTHSKLHGIKEAKNFFFSHQGYVELKRRFQNSRAPLKELEDALRLTGKLLIGGDAANDAFTQISLSAGRAESLVLAHVKPHMDKIEESLAKYAKDNNISIQQALARIDMFMTAEHEAERRMVKWLTSVPLSTRPMQAANGKTISPAELRDKLMLEVYSNKDLVTNGRAKLIRARLEELARDHAEYTDKKSSPYGKRTVDINSPEYSVAGNHTPEFFAEVRREFAKDKEKNGATLQTLVDSITALQGESRKLDKQANYWSQPVDNIVALYGYKHYVPFKGKPGSKVSEQDEYLDIGGSRMGKDFREFAEGFQGRLSDADNVILQAMTDSVRSAMRAGRQGVTERIKNLLNQKFIKGDANYLNIPFTARYKDLDADQLKNPNLIFHYNEDGSIDVLQITDPRMREAIRSSFTPHTPVWDFFNKITSTVGQFHTRYNIAFHPYNFVRDSLTNSFIIGSDFDPKTAGAVMKSVANNVATMNIAKAGQISKWYDEGNIDKIREKAQNDAFYRDALEYLQQGGRVSFVQGLSTKTQAENLLKELGPSRVVRTKRQLDKVVDIWSEVFELTARVSAYSVIKDKMIQQGIPRAQAPAQAAAYVKNLANFEQVGVWGKQAGSLFMFFRPSATGAVRAIEAVTPAMPWITPEKMMANLPDTIRKDPAAVAEFKKNFEHQRKMARQMMLAMAGAGASMYLLAYAMSDEDETGRNKVATDDMGQWQRNARMPLPFTDKLLNIPWGFGFGAFSAIGAQVMGAAIGQGGFGNALVNSAQIMLDSFLPLPVSKIDPTDDITTDAAKWFLDTIIPSILRPGLEYVMNTNAIGQDIYAQRVSKYGDAYTGGETVPDLYKDLARWMVETFNGEVNVTPNVLNFWVNNYADGLGRLAISGWGMAGVVTGSKAYDAKGDMALFSSFVGRKSNYDGKKYAQLRDEMEDMKSKLRMFENNPEQYERYLRRKPYAQAAVDYFNKAENGLLRKLQTQRNQIIADRNLTPAQKTKMLQDLTLTQNFVKRNIINTLTQMGVEP